MLRSLPITLCLGVLLAAACAPQNAPIVRVTKKPTLQSRPTGSPTSGVVTQPGQGSPTPGATGAPTATPGPDPTMYVPSQGPGTPLPSGYVSPLPSDAFPSPTPTPVGTTTPTGPTPTPLPTPAVVDGQILTNTLPAGLGELTGYVVEPIAGKAGEYRPITGVTVLVSNQADATEKAKLTNASNGTFRVPDVALGDYYVRVEKSGYAADSAATPVRLYPGRTSGHTLFLIIPDVPAP